MQISKAPAPFLFQIRVHAGGGEFLPVVRYPLIHLVRDGAQARELQVPDLIDARRFDRMQGATQLGAGASPISPARRLCQGCVAPFRAAWRPGFRVDW